MTRDVLEAEGNEAVEEVEVSPVLRVYSWSVRISELDEKLDVGTSVNFG